MSVGGPSAPHTEDPLINRVLSERYRILKKLGEGGMGIVYLAEHIVIEKKIALKILFPDLTRRDDLVQRFMQEAKSASRIGHENVIDITDFGQSPEGYVFIAMEYLEGQDLGQVLKASGPMPWARAQPIILQIVKALRAAHERGIVHRDMKPENVFVVPRDDGREFVKVLDFGIAKVLGLEEDAPRLTRTGMIFGTPEYMSPEQAQGQSVDHRVDIYAVGCLLYHMLTGEVPFKAESFMGILSKHMLEAPLPPSVRNPSIEPAVEAIISRAMEKDPNKRFQTMRQFVEALVPLGHVPDMSGGISVATGMPVHRSGPAPREATKPLPAVSTPSVAAAPFTAVAMPVVSKKPVAAHQPSVTEALPLPAALQHATKEIEGRSSPPLAAPNPEARRSQTEFVPREDSGPRPLRRRSGNLVVVAVGVGAVLLIGVVFLALRGSSSGTGPAAVGTAVAPAPASPGAAILQSPPSSAAAAPAGAAVAHPGTPSAIAPAPPVAPAGEDSRGGARRTKDSGRPHRTSREAVDSMLPSEGPGQGEEQMPSKVRGKARVKTPAELKNPFATPGP